MLKKNVVVIAVIILSFFTVNANASMFGYDEVEHQDIKEFTKWESVLNKYNREIATGSAGLQKWGSGIAKIAALPTARQRIMAMNDFVNNSISYSPDSNVWGRSDYWAAPGETFGKGEGDCDDYAIAKYFGLRQMGFSENNMRIVILKDNRKNELHAVLAVKEGGKYFILDNQSEYVVEDTQLSYYEPIYSINSSGWWQHS